MPDRFLSQRPLTGEVLPPQKPDTFLPQVRPLSGVPLVNRMRYNAARRELESYLDVLKARNAVLREINETAALAEGYSRRLVRMERIEDLRLIESMKIDAEMDSALRTIKLGAAENRIRSLNAEAELIEAERRLAALRTPTPVEAARPAQSESARITEEINNLREREKELIAAFRGEAASEDELSDDDRELICDVRLATRNRITRLIEEMGQ